MGPVPFGGRPLRAQALPRVPCCIAMPRLVPSINAIVVAVLMRKWWSSEPQRCKEFECDCEARVTFLLR